MHFHEMSGQDRLALSVDHIARIAVRNPTMVEVGRYYGLTLASCVPADPQSKGGSEATVRPPRNGPIERQWSEESSSGGNWGSVEDRAVLARCAPPARDVDGFTCCDFFCCVSCCPEENDGMRVRTAKAIAGLTLRMNTGTECSLRNGHRRIPQRGTCHQKQRSQRAQARRVE